MSDTQTGTRPKFRGLFERNPKGFPLDPDCEHRVLSITMPIELGDLLARGIEGYTCQDCGKTGQTFSDFKEGR